MKRTFLIGAAAVLMALTGCSAPEATTSEQVVEPSEPCKAAFDAASNAIESLYATHPFYGDEYDAIYADGTVTPDEQVQLDAWLADEEAQYAAINDPLYDACNGVEDFYAGAYEQGERADWSLEGNETISTQELKEIFLSSRCYQQEHRPACSDYSTE